MIRPFVFFAVAGVLFFLLAVETDLSKPSFSRAMGPEPAIPEKPTSRQIINTRTAFFCAGVYGYARKHPLVQRTLWILYGTWVFLYGISSVPVYIALFDKKLPGVVDELAAVGILMGSLCILAMLLIWGALSLIEKWKYGRSIFLSSRVREWFSKKSHDDAWQDFFSQVSRESNVSLPTWFLFSPPLSSSGVGQFLLESTKLLASIVMTYLALAGAGWFTVPSWFSWSMFIWFPLWMAVAFSIFVIVRLQFSQFKGDCWKEGDTLSFAIMQQAVLKYWKTSSENAQINQSCHFHQR